MVLAWALRGNFMGRMTVLPRSLGGTVTVPGVGVPQPVSAANSRPQHDPLDSSAGYASASPPLRRCSPRPPQRDATRLIGGLKQRKRWRAAIERRALTVPRAGRHSH